jgi:hypothetical protein
MTLLEVFEQHNDRVERKLFHYIEIYERYLAQYVGKKTTLLELGVCDGGSLQIWKKYLGNKATIVGIDINPESFFEEDQIKIYIGDQKDTKLLKEVCEKHPPDIIIDDGSHRSADIIASFEILFPLLNKNGLYSVEDLYFSYRPKFVKGGVSFVNYTKRMLDVLNRHRGKVASIHFYPGIVIFEKREGYLKKKLRFRERKLSK